MNYMSLQLSNLFICGFEGTVLTRETSEKLLELNPAGLILFDTNIQTKEQVKKLTVDLKDLLGEDLLISVDQEGGKVERLRRVAASLPSLYSLGLASLEKPRYLGDFVNLFADELLELGFNFVFAPCLDLNTNPHNPIIGTRSLGVNSQIVSEQLTKMFPALNSFPLLNCAKHFPGHGDSSKDSHLDLPFIDFSDEVKFCDHLAPFRVAIENNVDAVMIAHAIYALPDAMKVSLGKYLEKLSLSCSLDLLDKLPASINPFFVEVLLKQELGFKGLCVTDEITMKALNRFGDYKYLCELMVKAGNDLIIWNTNIDEALAVERSSPFCHFSKAIKTRIENSYEKIRTVNLKFKKTNLRSKVTNEERLSLSIQMKSIVKDAFSKLNLLTDDSFKNRDFYKSIINKLDCILVISHPKLEIAVLKKVFPLPTLIEVPSISIQSPYYLSSMPEVQKLKDQESSNILLLTFQSWSNTLLDENIRDLKVNFSHVIHVESDFVNPNADLNLAGANRLHYEALLDL